MVSFWQQSSSWFKDNYLLTILRDERERERERRRREREMKGRGWERGRRKRERTQASKQFPPDS